MNVKHIVVVGAGPAGMMAAIRAGRSGCAVTLIEKNPSPGRKLLFSGKGRCNLTNLCELEDFLQRFSGGGEFLRDAFAKFFHHQLIDFFQGQGLKFQVERQRRVFPVSGGSLAVLEALKKELSQRRLKVLYGAPVSGILITAGEAKGVRLKDGREIPADKVILATGGLSYKFTGSTGDGLRWAEGLHHRITPLRPGLVPLLTEEGWPGKLAGLALKNIRIRFTASRHKITSETGEMLFTDKGISGPLVLSLSGKIADWLAEGLKVSAEIDLKPGLSVEQLDNRLLREFKAAPRKSFKSVLYQLLPKRLAGVLLEISGVSAKAISSQVTQKERRVIAGLLKALPLQVRGCEPLEEAMVTRGGVSLKDIDPRTMQSRLVKGLYFCGEMIDVDADTGGFNLQAAFSTGWLAGENAAG